MKSIENQSLFSEITTEEAVTINGASRCHSRNVKGGSHYVYCYPRRSHYQEEYSRRHNYGHYRDGIALSAVVIFY